MLYLIFMEISKYYSPNHYIKLRSSKSITFIIIHYTGMQSERESLKKLINVKSKVSCHYLINRKGKIFKMVKDRNIAWHAGKSKWKNYVNLNKNSIGIELVNKGHKFGYQSFTSKQISSLVILCKSLKKKHGIKDKFILGHSDIAPIRKIDPGEKFPWEYLSIKGVGIYPKKKSIDLLSFKKPKKKKFFKNLYKVGYRYLHTGSESKIIKNFQRKYLQNNVTGQLDLETYKISEFLAQKSNIS